MSLLGSPNNLNFERRKPSVGSDINIRDAQDISSIVSQLQDLTFSPKLNNNVSLFRGKIIEKIADQFMPGGKSLATYRVRVEGTKDSIYLDPFNFPIGSEEYNIWASMHSTFQILTENLSQVPLSPKDIVYVTFLDPSNQKDGKIVFIETYKPELAGGNAVDPLALLPVRDKPMISKKEIKECKTQLEKEVKKKGPRLGNLWLARGPNVAQFFGVVPSCIKKEIRKMDLKGCQYSPGAAGRYSTGKFKTADNINPPKYDHSGLFYATLFSLGAKIPRTAAGMKKASIDVSETFAEQTPTSLVFFHDSKTKKITHVEMSSGDGSTMGSQPGIGVKGNFRWGWWKDKAGANPATKKWDKFSYGVLPHICALAKKYSTCPVVPRAADTSQYKPLEQKCKQLWNKHKNDPATSPGFQEAIKCYRQLSELSANMSRVQRKVARYGVSAAQAMSTVARQDASNQKSTANSKSRK